MYVSKIGMEEHTQNYTFVVRIHESGRTERDWELHVHGVYRHSVLDMDNDTLHVLNSRSHSG